MRAHAFLARVERRASFVSERCAGLCAERAWGRGIHLSCAAAFKSAGRSTTLPLYSQPSSSLTKHGSDVPSRRARKGRRTSRVGSIPGPEEALMTRARRVPLIGVLSIAAICLAAPASAQQRPAIADQIAKTYGLDSFGEIEAIRYTFHIDLPALKFKVVRTWIWE